MNFRKRSERLELIDTGEYTSDEYEGCLRELRGINRFLGDARALKKSLLREIEKQKLKKYSLLDLGAGSGELLRVCAEDAQQNLIETQLYGVELNARSAAAIKEESKNFENIHAVRADAFRLPFADDAFDFVVCSLFTHHFSDEKIVAILREMKRVARRKIFVIDLHRHFVAYYFYTTAGKIFLRNRLIRHDGALSILRSFKPNELRVLGERAALNDLSVKRYFPYRLVLSGI